jgi:hypothetical protein
VKIVGFSPDDMLNANMSSHFFRQTLPLYDLYLTTKSYNVAELTALGCPRTIFVPNAYDPATHRPLPDDSEPIAYTADVGFIGTFEPDRAGLIEREFCDEGDLEQALSLVRDCEAIPRSRQLAEGFARQAHTAIDWLPPSEARGALRALPDFVLSRLY